MNVDDLAPGSAPLTIIAPHLDDAVFSCGRLLAQHRDTLVVTVFAGVPADGTVAPEWDRDAGFLTAGDAVRARRREDEHALALLGARPAWLDFLDGQYGVDYAPADIACVLTALLRRRGGTVLAPMGVHHPDHERVHAACMLMREAEAEADGNLDVTAHRKRTWMFYEDAIHRLTPGVVAGRLAWWRRLGLVPTLVAALPAAGNDVGKAAAVAAYASQLPLFDAVERDDLRSPERYWALDAE